MQLRNYALVTAGYWAFTITDGALRLLVLLHFHDLGYSPVSLAFFLLYEFMGIVTNLLGGWVGARRGLNQTLLAGLSLQIVALVILALHSPAWVEWVSVAYVMGAQALSGVAKDLTKMSSKSAVKYVAGDGDNALFDSSPCSPDPRMPSRGSASSRCGAARLAGLRHGAVRHGRWHHRCARSRGSPAERRHRQILEETATAIGPVDPMQLTDFRLLASSFSSRDIWFVVALPVFLDEILGWSFTATGAFLAAW